jgi:Leucine-rich repeat (LRR) protein
MIYLLNLLIQVFISTRKHRGLYGCEVENITIDSPNYRVASISGKHSDKISNSDVEYVWIKNSQTKFLPRFSPIFFPKMKKYLITSSGLKSISRDDFMGMSLLETVDFSHNDLEEIPEDTLYDLNELVDFFISNNKIKYLSSKLLSQAPLFQRFRAENNTLEQLDADFFSNNPSLKIVTLDNNRLAKIKIDFRPFKNLKKVDLLNNPCINTSYNDWRKQNTVEGISKEIEAKCA